MDLKETFYEIVDTTVEREMPEIHNIVKKALPSTVRDIVELTIRDYLSPADNILEVVGRAFREHFKHEALEALRDYVWEWLETEDEGGKLLKEAIVHYIGENLDLDCLFEELIKEER